MQATRTIVLTSDEVILLREELYRMREAATPPEPVDDIMHPVPDVELERYPFIDRLENALR